MTAPRLGPAPVPGRAAGPILPRVQRPKTLAPQDAAQAGFDFTLKRNDAPPPSLWDQASGAITGLPGGLLGLAGETAKSVAGFPRLAIDAAQEATGHGGGFSKDYGTNLGEYFPVLETFRGSGARTAHRVTHPQEYLEASKRGEIVPALLEDVANASIVAGPAAKTFTAASGAERAAAAGAAEGGLAGRFFSPSEAVAGSAVRPRLFQAGQALERAAGPLEAGATAPARVWTAPLKLVKGMDLPERIFGTTAAGEARQVGLKPLLDQTGVTKRVVESPTGRAVGDAFTKWRDERQQARDIRENYLLPQSAELHVASNELDKALKPAREALGNDAELEYANHLVRAGQEPNLRALKDLRNTLDETQYNDLVSRALGREQAPTPRTIDLALDYLDGNLDPALVARMDRAWEFERKALGQVEAMKVEGEGRAPLNPEQLGDAPMVSRIDARVGALQSRANQLRDELYGASPGDAGLVGDTAAARGRVPEPNMEQLVGQRAQGAARRAGVLEGERLVQERTAGRAAAGAETAGARAGEARLGTIEGARDAMGQLQQERYGFPKYEPEWTATQRQIGEAERAAGPPAPSYTVADDELALAQHIGRLEGQGRTVPVERAAGVAERAAGSADVAGARGAAAQGRIFTGAAEPHIAPGPRRGELPFGQASVDERARLTPMSDKEASQYVREVRQVAVQKIEQRIADTEGRISRVMDGPIEIPRPGSPMIDAWDAIRNEVGRYVNNFKIAGERLFKKSRRGDVGGGLGTGAEAAAQRTDSLDAFLDRYDPGEANVNNALEAFIQDLREIADLREQRGAVMRDGVRDPSLIAESASELAALTGTREAALREVKLAHADEVLPQPEYGAAPWSMDREAYKVELGDVQSELAQVANVPFEQWPESARRAERRMLELTPEVIDAQGLTADVLYDRIREVAQVVGRDIPAKTFSADVTAAGTAGRAATDEAHTLAQDAFELDPLTRQRAAAEGRQVTADELIFTQLTPDERIMYRQLVEQSKAEGAQGRLEGARSRLTVGLRSEGERAGQRVGEQVGQERLLGRQATSAQQRAEALVPRVETASDRAVSVAAEDAGRPLRFGERRGKRLRDVQILEREVRTKEGKLRWLEEEKIPALQARLEQGPREVAPGKYVPALATGERLRSAVQEMGAALAEETGDPAMAGRLEQLVADVPETMSELQALGIFPEYITGAVDEPTSGTPTVAGAQEQLPYEGPTPSMHRKTYGHVPKQVRTLQRSLVKELAAIMRNKAADRIRTDIAHVGHDLLDELVRRGELDVTTAEGLRTHGYDRSIDLAKEMERHGFSAWDPESPRGAVSDRMVTADSFFIPTPIAREFQRWWKPASRNPVVRGYDRLTRSFKTGVLALSPSWQVNNVLGNAFMAVVFGGESPATIFRMSQEARRLMKMENELGTAQLPPRLFGAGQAAEITRQFAEHAEPRTAFGRTVNRSYRLNETIDNIGRSALYLAKRAKGFSEEEAVAMSLRAMGDFSNLTSFERDVVRRTLPFYAWMRHITQASYHLAIEHPFRTAWLMHVSDMFNHGAQDPNVPDWLKGALNLGGGSFVPFGGANPLQGNAGSLFTSPRQWPGEIMRSLNPVIKAGAASIGLNLSQGRPVTRPPGTGPVDQFSKPLWTFQSPNEIAYMVARMLPQGRLFTDVVQDPVVRYDTGQPVKRLGRSIPLEGGRLTAVAKDLNLPFVPIHVNEEELRQRIIKGRRAMVTARRNYNR